jgi:hypothetical protein
MNSYLIEFTDQFQIQTSCKQYEAETPQEAIRYFRAYHALAYVHNIALCLPSKDFAYSDKYGIDTKAAEKCI